MSWCVDPSSNLTQIQEISDWILKAKVPLSPDILKMKLEELKNLAANLPNSTAVLKEAEPQLDTARKLLQEAQDARCAPPTPTTHTNTLENVDLKTLIVVLRCYTLLCTCMMICIW